MFDCFLLLLFNQDIMDSTFSCTPTESNTKYTNPSNSGSNFNYVSQMAVHAANMHVRLDNTKSFDPEKHLNKLEASTHQTQNDQSPSKSGQNMQEKGY